MYKRRIPLILMLLMAFQAAGQQIVFEKDPAIDSTISSWGPNRKHYIHYILGVGFAVDQGEKGGQIRQPHFFDEARLGFRYKRKLAEYVSVGTELVYNLQNFSIKQNDQKILPDTLHYQRQRMIFHQLRGGVYLRFNYDRRGDRLGRFIDLGAYGDYTFAHTFSAKYKNPDQSITKASTSHLKYFNPFGYGVLVRAGFNSWSVYAQYRFSDLFYPSRNLPELPRITVGVEWTLKK